MSSNLMSNTQRRRLMRSMRIAHKKKHPNNEKVKARKIKHGFNPGPPKKKSKPWLKDHK